MFSKIFNKFPRIVLTVVFPALPVIAIIFALVSFLLAMAKLFRNFVVFLDLINFFSFKLCIFFEITQ